MIPHSTQFGAECSIVVNFINFSKPLQKIIRKPFNYKTCYMYISSTINNIIELDIHYANIQGIIREFLIFFKMPFSF